MLFVHRRLGIVVLALALCLYANAATAQWRYEEQKDSFTDEFIYARAINRAVSNTDEVFNIAVVCRRDLRTILIMPTVVWRFEKLNVRFRVDDKPLRKGVWQDANSFDRTNRALLVTPDDWQNIVKESKTNSRLTVGVDLIGLSEAVMTFSMAGFENVTRVQQECAARNR